jgi:PPIC-type PPIASE domain
MMRALWVGFLLIGTTVGAQDQRTAPAAASKPSAPADQHGDEGQKSPAATDIAADAPVLTVKGLCAPVTTTRAERTQSVCQTVVTRAQFEKLFDALRPGMDVESKRHLAKAYPQFLVLAHEAEQRGLDKQPRFEERLDFARLQILSQELMRQVQEEAVQVPAGDVEDYYRKNIAEFEVASFERIVIPVRTQLPQPVAAQGNAAEDVMTKEAELLRIRAAAGEDFSKLQTQAYAAAGVSGDNAPNPKMDKIRRRSLPPAHASVFDLRLNEVSPVLNDPTGHYIYKLDWKGTESLDTVRNEISNTLRGQRVRKMMESLEQPYTIEVNEAYFGADGNNDSD